MKELIRVRVQYASRQQCCRTNKKRSFYLVTSGIDLTNLTSQRRRRKRRRRRTRTKRRKEVKKEKRKKKNTRKKKIKRQRKELTKNENLLQQ